MIGNCCSLVLCSTSHHGLQLKGMNQGGNPFALAETRIQNQYIHAKSMILSLCQIMLFKKQQSHSGHKSYLSSIDPQPLPSSTYGKKRVGNSSAKVDLIVPQEQIVWYDRQSKKITYVLGHVGTSRLIGSGPIRPPVSPSKGQSDVLQAIDHSVTGSMTAQPPGIRLSALRVATYGQQVASLGGGLTPLQRCSRRILQPQPTGRQY